MAILFDGKRFAAEKEKELANKVSALKKRGVTPRLETILDGSNKASKIYVGLKKKAADRIGAEMGVYHIANNKPGRHNFIINLISTLNKDKTVHGVMVQLPLSKRLKSFTKEIVETIASKKDVDGQRERSLYTPATVKAVIEIIDYAKKVTNETRKNREITVCVMGAKGMVGSGLVKHLKKLEYQVLAFDTKHKRQLKKIKSASILISAIGKPNIIKAKMVKSGTIVIDVGSPKGDVLFNEVVGKASFITPVPGGVGPVTVACLMENLVNAASSRN